MKTILMTILMLTGLYAEKTFYKTSYDCGKVKEYSVEWRVCTRKNLAELDIIMSKLYHQALLSSPTPSTLKKKQLEWIGEKNKYHYYIAGSYFTQINYLRNLISKQEQKYSDIWDFAFPVKEKHFGQDINVISNIDQDYLFYIYHSMDKSYTTGQFFQQKTIKIKSSKINEITKEYSYYPKSKIINFSNGNQLSEKTFSQGARCTSSFGRQSRLILKDKDGNIIKEGILFVKLDTSYNDTNGYCESGDFKNQQIDLARTVFYPLNDDTFLIALNNKYIVRFDSSFNTKSQLEGSKFFWLDADKYDKFEKEHRMYLFEEENRVILKWMDEQVKDSLAND